MDDAYNMEPEELAEMMKKNQENAESKMGGKFDEKSKEKPKFKGWKVMITEPWRSICTQWAL